MNPLSLDRYLYTLSNPLKFVDPTGHVPCFEDGYCPGDSASEEEFFDGWADYYGLEFDGDWTSEKKWTVLFGVQAVGMRFSNAFNGGMQSGDAFKAVYGNTFKFNWSNATPGWAGFTHSKNEITFYSLKGSENYLENHSGLVIHELGHAFNNVLNKQAQRVPEELIRPATLDVNGNAIIQHGDPSNFYYGYAGGWETWQYGYIGNRGSEEFADMFIGWVFNQWNSNPRSTFAATRSNYMNSVMPQHLVTIFP